MSFSLLLLGFLMGMRHATEADHLAAMATLASRGPSVRSMALQGAAWGSGHTLTLLLFGGIALAMGGIIPDSYAHWLELSVGLMLIILGLDVLRQMRRNRVHFHSHRHADGIRHFHAHTHSEDTPHNPDHHRHEHTKGLPTRALFVGLMHGMAGSAAIVVLTAQQASNLASALLYILLFGTGSILGMTVLSTAMIIPIRRFQAKGLTRGYQGIQLAIATLTVSLGTYIAWQNILEIV